LQIKKTFNGLANAYEECKKDLAWTANLVDVCEQRNVAAENYIVTLRLTLNTTAQSVENLDQQNILLNDRIKVKDSVISNNKKIATKKTIGWTVGGFSFGVCVATLVFLLK